MDILLLPAQGEDRNNAALYTGEAAHAVGALCDWLRTLGQGVRLVIRVSRHPEETEAQARCLQYLREGRNLPVLALADRARVAGHLGRCPVLRQAIEAVIIDDGDDRPTAMKERAAAAAALGAALPGEGPERWRLWLHRQHAPGNFARLLAYEAAGQRLRAREEPLSGLTPAESGEAAEVPAFLAAEPLPCTVFEAAITVTGDGRYWACPRHAGRDDGVLGNTSDTPPETLIACKGRMLDAVGRLPACITCEELGRFFWPADRIPEIEALMNEARRHATAPAGAEGASQAEATYVPAEGEAHDLSEASPEEQDDALDDFAARLDAWADAVAEETDAGGPPPEEEKGDA